MIARPVRGVRKLVRAIGTTLRRAMLILASPGTELGKGASIAVGCRIRVTDGGRFLAGRNIGLSDYSAIIVKHGTLQIGDNGHIGIGSIITCREAITMGHDVLIAEYVSVRDQDHRYGGPEPTARNGFDTAPIVIGDNVWIGAKATITRGVTIGDNCVIGANSVVTTDIPANTVAAGAPAKVVKRI